MAAQKLISVPIAVHVDLFRWQLDLFWYNHQRTYGDDAAERMRAVIIKRNYRNEPKHQMMEWDSTVPHVMCESVFEYPEYADLERMMTYALPLNIQVGLAQALPTFDDEQLIEVNDCDMFHFRKAPPMHIGDDELYVSDLYEEWHLKSLSEHRNVIAPYFENGGGYYNGGFVPIIGKVKTFKKIMYEWLAVHAHILRSDWPDIIKWWAGMYALQAACEKAKVTMIGKDILYAPGINPLTDAHYIAHYCVDNKFTKKTFPNINIGSFEKNIYYGRLLEWFPKFLAQDFPKE